MADRKVVAFDTETRGLDWFDENQQAFLVSWADEDGSYTADWSDGDGLRAFVDAMESADVVVAHNLSFDTHQLRETLGFDPLRTDYEDTDIISRVIHPEGQRKGERGGHRLKDLATIYVDPTAKDAEDRIKEMGKSIGLRTMRQNDAYYDVWRAYPDVMEEYAKKDAYYTRELYLRWEKEAAESSIYQLEKRVMPILIDAEEKGVQIDQEEASRLQREYKGFRDELYEVLDAELGYEALGGEGSQEALLEALQKLGVPLHRKTDTGRLSTSRYALQEFEDDYPELGRLMEYRRVEKFLSTFLDPMVEAPNAVLHTSFRQCEAWTGRMSSARPNLQNLPKRAGVEVRKPIVPREGHALICADYDSIEVRLLAYYMNDADYIALVRDGLDPHAWMATHIWGGKPADYAKGTEGEAQRNVAKNTLFAIVYGAGGPRVADMNKIDIDEARALISKIKNSLPGWARLSKRIRDKVARDGHVTTMFGRKQPIKRDKAYVGLNALIQGTAADIMKQGLVNVHESTREMVGTTPLLVVHDELVLEAPVEATEHVARLTTEGMKAAANIDPPLEVTTSIVTTNYADA